MHNRRSSLHKISLISPLFFTKDTTYLMVRENQAISKHNILPPPSSKHHNLSDVFRRH
jgi:hypothetical protein